MRRPQVRALAVGEGAEHPVRNEVLLGDVVGAAEDARLELRTDGHGPTLTPPMVGAESARVPTPELRGPSAATYRVAGAPAGLSCRWAL